MADITEDDVTAALGAVIDPSQGKSVVELGMVGPIHIKQSNISFALEVPAHRGPAMEPVRKAAETAVRAIPGVTSATVVVTAHSGPAATSASAGGGDDSDDGVVERVHEIKVRRFVAVASGKGGVGKSTTSINLALAIAATGQRVGILDADIYGPSLPRLIGQNKKPQSDGKKIYPIEAWGLQTMSIGYLVAEDAPTIWRGPMVMSAIEQMLRDVAWDNLDVLIIDMPPGTGDAQLTLSQRAALSGAVIVSTPQDLALIDARKGLNMFRKVNVPVLGIIENMSHFICTDCGSRHDIFGHGGAAAEAARIGAPFLGEVPLEMAIRATSDEGTPVVAKDPGGPHAAHYTAIAGAVMAQLDDAVKAGPKIVIE